MQIYTIVRIELNGDNHPHAVDIGRDPYLNEQTAQQEVDRLNEHAVAVAQNAYNADHAEHVEAYEQNQVLLTEGFEPTPVSPPPERKTITLDDLIFDFYRLETSEVNVS